MIPKIKTTYKRSGDADLLELGDRVTENMTGNPEFSDAIPSVAELQQKCDDFRLAKALAGRSDRTKISAKNDAKAALSKTLADIAAYVTNKCQGDRTKLLSSGFDITGQKSASQELPPITTLEVEIGQPGQATTRIKKVRGAKSYMHQYTNDPLTSDSVWISETITDYRYTFNSLQSVTRYLFRVIAIGPNKQKVYSPIVARVIQ